MAPSRSRSTNHGSRRQHQPGVLRAVVSLALVGGLLISAVPVTADHNSAGAEVAVVNPDEFDRDGARAPDVPDEARPTFHDGLDDPRRAPRDQSGDRYDPGSCTPASSYFFNSIGRENYEDDLRAGLACYVGYVDVQWTYVVPGSWLDPRWQDPAYPANPSPDDDYCLGREGDYDHPTVGWDLVDELVARASRSNDPECHPETHSSAVAGDVMVDTDLVEAAIQGEANAPGASDVTGTEAYSGTQSLPLMVRPVVLLFGQPHPDNPDPAHFEAGEGPFGSNPGALGSPIRNLEGACGDRTRACQLLTPYDLKLYDDRYDKPDIDREECDPYDRDAELGCLPARACSYLPQFAYAGARPSHTGPCGPLGHRLEFDDDIDEGGLGATEAPTWFSNLPGWKGRWYLMPRGEVAGSLQGARGLIEEEAMPEGLVHVAAVNPTVPKAEGPRWCIRPNIVTTAPSGVRADGYRYRADAIDVDLYRRASHQPFEDVDEADGGALERPWRQARQAARDAVPESVEHLVGPPLEAAESASDRADPSESPRSDEPDQLPFSREYDALYRCEPDGRLVSRQQSTRVDGGVEMDAMVRPATVTLKDPTKLDFGDGLLAEESATRSTPWQPEAYTFDGEILGYLDRNQNGETDPCAVPGGPPQPDRDRCVWRPTWDAYNPNCRVGWTRCAEMLRADGYDVDDGVGLAFTWKIRGPTVVAPREPVDDMPSADAWTNVRVPDESKADQADEGIGFGCRGRIGSYTVFLRLRSSGYASCPAHAGTSRSGPAALPSGARAWTGAHGDHAGAGGGAVVEADAVDERTLQERSRIVGFNDLTAMNCVVGTSYGLADRLVETTDARGDEDLARRLCGDVDGEVVLVRDAFKDQDARLGGTFQSAIRLVKLKPSPKQVDEAEEERFGWDEPEPLTVEAFLSTDEERLRPTRDTLDNVRLEDPSIADLEPTLSDRDLLEPRHCLEPDAGRETVTEQEVGAPDVDPEDGLGDCWASEYAEMLGEELDPLWDLDCDTQNNLEEFRWETIPIYDVPTRYAFDHCGKALRGHAPTRKVVFENGRDLDLDYLIDGYETRYIARDHDQAAATTVGDLLDPAGLAAYHPLNDVDSDEDGTRDLEDPNSDSRETDGDPASDTIQDGIEVWLLDTFPDHGDSDCSIERQRSEGTAFDCHGSSKMVLEDDDAVRKSSDRGRGDGVSDSVELWYFAVAHPIWGDLPAHQAAENILNWTELHEPDRVGNVLLDPANDADGLGDADDGIAAAAQQMTCGDGTFDPDVPPQARDTHPGSPADGGVERPELDRVDNLTEVVRALRADHPFEPCETPGSSSQSTAGRDGASLMCLSPTDPDSDDDGIPDGIERAGPGLDPCDPSDGGLGGLDVVEEMGGPAEALGLLDREVVR